MKHFEANFFVYPTQLKLNANSRFHALLARSFALRPKKKKKGKKKIVSQALSYTRIIHGSQFSTRKEREGGGGGERKYLVPQIDFLTAARGQLFWTRSRRLCIETNRSSRVIVDKLSFDTASSIRGILYFRARKSLIVAVFSRSSFFLFFSRRWSIKMRIDRFLNESIMLSWILIFNINCYHIINSFHSIINNEY